MGAVKREKQRRPLHLLLLLLVTLESSLTPSDGLMDLTTDLVQPCPQLLQSTIFFPTISEGFHTYGVRSRFSKQKKIVKEFSAKFKNLSESKFFELYLGMIQRTGIRVRIIQNIQSRGITLSVSM